MLESFCLRVCFGVLLMLVVLSLFFRPSSSLLVYCGTCAYNDIIHPLVFLSTPPSLSKGQTNAEDPNQNSSLFSIPILSSHFVSEALCLIPPFFWILQISRQCHLLDPIGRKRRRHESKLSLSPNIHLVTLVSP